MGPSETKGATAGLSPIIPRTPEDAKSHADEAASSKQPEWLLYGASYVPVLSLETDGAVPGGYEEVDSSFAGGGGIERWFSLGDARIGVRGSLSGFEMSELSVSGADVKATDYMGWVGALGVVGRLDLSPLALDLHAGSGMLTISRTNQVQMKGEGPEDRASLETTAVGFDLGARLSLGLLGPVRGFVGATHASFPGKADLTLYGGGLALVL